MNQPEQSWPEFCCAILRDGDGRYLLEHRPTHKRYAGGQVVCFGGRRERGESPDACIRRELREELGWEAGELTLAVRLLISPGRRELAWFFRGDAPPNPQPKEAGVTVAWRTRAEVESGAGGLSAWHLAALRSELAGCTEAEVAPSPPDGEGNRENRPV